MRRVVPVLLLIACDDPSAVFTTVQPAGIWVDAAGTQVTSGPSLEYIDTRGVVWMLDWRTGQPTAYAPYPRTIYLHEGCTGTAFPEASVPPLHAMVGPDGSLFLAQPAAQVQIAPTAWVDAGDRCDPVPGGTGVYAPSAIIALRGVPHTSYQAPLRKVLPDAHGHAP